MAATNCEACRHLWSVHGPSGCHAKVYPAHSLTGDRCPCRHTPLRAGLTDVTPEDGSDEDRPPEGAIGNPRPLASAHGQWTLVGYDELGFACLDEECPGCQARALIINELNVAECLTCAWRETPPIDMGYLSLPAEVQAAIEEGARDARQ